jgi:hypothetical protein
MKITALAALVMVAGTGAEARGGTDQILKNAAETVQICSDNTADNGLNLAARSVASQMFAGIGVGIEWHHAASCPAGAFRVSFADHTPAKLMPEALAYALPYEGTHIVIFYDRVQARATGPRKFPVLMGHVMAHEVTHVLEGMSRHSEEGVMKGHWTQSDYTSMCWKPLKFADEDVMLVHRGLERRAARRNSAQSVIAAETAGLIGRRADHELLSGQ